MTRAMVLRGVGFALAIVLGGVAVWLIVTSTTQKRIEIGVLTGLWGLLLGAYSMFGSRKPLQYVDDLPDVSQPGGAVELRPRGAALERAEDLAERRAFQASLEQMLRREVQTAVRLEVGELRSEIAALRSELLEKVGGQIRLERIETTRVIGSDLEALQQEVRQLKAAREAGFPAPATPSILDLGIASGPAEQVITRLIPAVAPQPAAPEPVLVVEPEPEAAAPIAPEPEPEPVPMAEPEAAALIAPEPEPEPVPMAEPEAAAPIALEPDPEPAASAPVSTVAESFPAEDPFAGLPRIRPFTEFLLDPIEAAPPAQVAEPVTNGSSQAGQPRRHAAADASQPAVPAERARAAATSTPRRHRRADESDAGQELLARLLAREGS
jgi:outer membrane biosynthesis protein TonB